MLPDPAPYIWHHSVCASSPVFTNITDREKDSEMWKKKDINKKSAKEVKVGVPQKNNTPKTWSQAERKMLPKISDGGWAAIWLCKSTYVVMCLTCVSGKKKKKKDQCGWSRKECSRNSQRQTSLWRLLLLLLLLLRASLHLFDAQSKYSVSEHPMWRDRRVIALGLHESSVFAFVCVRFTIPVVVWSVPFLLEIGSRSWSCLVLGDACAFLKDKNDTNYYKSLKMLTAVQGHASDPFTHMTLNWQWSEKLSVVHEIKIKLNIK